MKYLIILILLLNSIPCFSSELSDTLGTINGVRSISTEITETRTSVTDNIEVKDDVTGEPETLDKKHPHLMKFLDSAVLIIVLKLTMCLL